MRRAKWWRLTVTIALVAAFAFGSLAAVAQPATAAPAPTQWSGSQTVMGSTSGLANAYSRTLVDSSGNLYVFFEAITALNQANVTVAKYSLSPGPAPSFLFTRSVNNGDMSLAFGTLLSVATDASGNLYCAWTRNSAYTIGHGSEIFVSMSADGGNSWSQLALASSPSSYGENANPSLAVNPTDRSIWVAWDQAWDASYNITISHSVDHGATFSGFSNITNQGDDNTVWPQLGIDSHARMYVLFENHTAVSGAPYTLYWTWSDGGSGWSTPQLFPSAIVGSFTPYLVVDSADRVYGVWYDWRETVSGVNTVRYRMSSDRGATWTADLAVNQGNLQSGNFPSLAVHGSTVAILWGVGGGSALGYVVSYDAGLTFSSEANTFTPSTASLPGGLVADANDAFYATYTLSTSPNSVGLKFWVGPPSRPAITSVAARTGYPQLTVTWAASPEPNVVEYVVYRSTDGSNYQAIATVGASTTSYLDYGLANGTYWYQIVAVNSQSVASLPSVAWSGTVGPTVAQLWSEIASLQAQLNSANANLASIQAQLTAIKNQAAALQGNTTALQNQIKNLQDQINTMQSQQATQTLSYANLAFEIIVVVLLVVLLLNQMRKPKSPRLMMAQPGQATSPKPEDEL